MKNEAAGVEFDAFGAISKLIETISARAGVSLDEACNMIRDHFLAEAAVSTKKGVN